MEIDLANLPDDTQALQALVRALADENAGLKADAQANALKITQLESRIAQLKRMQFGQSSERITREIEQLELELDELHEDEGAHAGALPIAVRARIESLAASLCQSICHVKKRFTNHPAPARAVVGQCAGSVRM
jgi:chromosome segregation ATPase